jgi:hypothetical protein
LNFATKQGVVTEVRSCYQHSHHRTEQKHHAQSNRIPFHSSLPRR